MTWQQQPAPAQTHPPVCYDHPSCLRSVHPRACVVAAAAAYIPPPVVVVCVPSVHCCCCLMHAAGVVVVAKLNMNAH